MANNTRVDITMKFSVNLDLVPGFGHEAGDWIKFIQREFMRQKHYHAECDVLNIEYIARK